MEIAGEYGDIQDIPFPQINPKATVHEILNLASGYCDDILKLKYQKELFVVHVMGEMTFVHTLVRFLQNHNIQCVASTTERLVLEEKEGKKTVQFNFIQFRGYPNI